MATRTALIRLLALVLAGSAFGCEAFAMPLDLRSGPTQGQIPVFRRDAHGLTPGRSLPAMHGQQDHFAGLTPEQRQQMRQQMRQHWQQVPPEQRGTPYQHRQNSGREGYQRMRDDRPPRDLRGHGGRVDGPGRMERER